MKKTVVLMLFMHTFFFAQGRLELYPDYKLDPKKAWESKFDDFIFKSFQSDDFTLPYRLYSPPKINKKNKYPLVIFLHGAGEKGIDNRTQFKRFNTVKFWEKHSCFIIAPECPDRLGDNKANSQWVDTPYGDEFHTMKPQPTIPLKAVIALIKEYLKNPLIDTSRVYITGLSMGGYATWEILQRKAEWFAAAIPVCGGGDLSYANKLVTTPIWAFHGDQDNTVPVSCSRNMINEIKKHGGTPKYTELKGVDHGAWTPTYSNAEVWDWLFQQRKK